MKIWIQKFRLSKRILPILLTLVFSNIFFLCLYSIDNKYTTSAPQAIQGVLFVSEGDWNAYPARYLWNGWCFYPDVLLTPETIKEEPENVRFLSIGQYGNFSLGDSMREVHGAGTYRLTLSLPEKPHIYAIELPEIFSSYRFYINDALQLEMGNPNPDGYVEHIQNRMVVFEACGTTTLLLAVRDASHYYSGMVYPPAFGEPLALNTARGLRIGLSLGVTILALLFALLSAYVFWRAKEKRSNVGSFFFLCVFSVLFFSYSVVHSFVPMASHPWYEIELCSRWLVMLFILKIHSNICETGSTPRKIALCAAGLFALAMLGYGVFSPWLTPQAVKIFAFLTSAFKILVAAYLLYTAGRSVAKRIPALSAVLFCAAIFYACSLLWDFLLPVYEPILGFWFQEWGCLALIAAVVAVLWYEIAVGYCRSLTYAEEKRQMHRQLEIQKEYYRQISHQLEENRRIRHDFRQHLRTVLSMSNQQEDIRHYIAQIASLDEVSRIETFCENRAVDALVNYYFSACAAQKISFFAQLALPETLPIPEVELCTLLGNLLENAVEACARQEQGERSIELKGRLDEDGFYLVVQNSFDGIVHRHREKFLSRKHDGLGIGLESVRNLIFQRHGIFEITMDGGVFKVSAMIPI